VNLKTGKSPKTNLFFGREKPRFEVHMFTREREKLFWGLFLMVFPIKTGLKKALCVLLCTYMRLKGFYLPSR